MSDDMEGKFKQIADMLGQNSNANIPDSVKGILNMLSTKNGTKEEDPTGEDSSQKHNTQEDSSKTNTDDVVDITRKMKKAINMLNPPNDPKVNLLNAIKPYLNKNRQRKLQTCMKLMKLGGLTKILDESEERPV